MLSSLLDRLCPSRLELRNKQQLLKELAAYSDSQKTKLQKLEDVISNNKTVFTDEVSKLAITSHAIHRYRERHKGQGTDDEISKMLFKLLIKQLYTMDKLIDGEYVLKRNVTGVVKNNTLVTILPPRCSRPGRANFKKETK